MHKVVVNEWMSPLLLGGGKGISCDDGARRPLKLVDHEVTTTGALLATYAAED